MRLINIACLFLSAVIGVTANEGQKKLTPAEIDERARLADAEIWHLTPELFEQRLPEGTWLIFFGARWCKFCKRLSPRWLGVQRRFLKEDLVERDFNIAKIDCTDRSDWCNTKGVDAYPTLYLYHNGGLIEEYSGDHEPLPIYNYIKEKIAYYEAIKGPSPPTESSGTAAPAVDMEAYVDDTAGADDAVIVEGQGKSSAADRKDEL